MQYATASGTLEVAYMYIGICHYAGCRNIPHERLATAPWDESVIVWPLAISADQTGWLLAGWNSCCPHAPWAALP